MTDDDVIVLNSTDTVERLRNTREAERDEHAAKGRGSRGPKTPPSPHTSPASTSGPGAGGQAGGSGDTATSPAGRATEAPSPPETLSGRDIARKRPVAWRNRALDRYADLKLQLDLIQLRQSGNDACVQRQIDTAYDWLDYAFHVASDQPRTGRKAKTVWRGSDIDNAWMALHRVHTLIVQLTPDGFASDDTLVDAQERARLLLKPKDARLINLNRASRPTDAANAHVATGTMRLAASALAAAYTANAEQHRQVRDFRNILVVTTVVTMLAAILLGVVGAVWPQALPLCWDSANGAICPSSPLGPTAGDIALVEFVGFIAAAVTGAIAIRHLRGTSTPYAVPMWSVLVKLPIGAVTAALGLMLLHVVPGLTVTSRYELIAWALLFGVSQEAFTRLLDRRAQSVLNSISTASKDGSADAAAKVAA